MMDSFFCSNSQYLVSHIPEKNKFDTPVDDLKDTTLTGLSENALSARLDQINQFLLHKALSSGLNLIHELFPLLNHVNTDIQAKAYCAQLRLADQIDPDELVESMMDQLICISWESQDTRYQTTRLSAAYVELFGKGLEKMTRARDWMLFIPFLANYYVKTMQWIETVLVEKSIPEWNQIILLFTHNCLDFIQFLNTKTVSESLVDFPYDSHDIGKESGDVKRRYLAFYLIHLVCEKIMAHLDMGLSKAYFDKCHVAYNTSNLMAHQPKKSNNQEDYLLFSIIQRCTKFVVDTGLSFEKLHQLRASLKSIEVNDKSEEDIMMENDRQMINARLYSLGSNGIAVLFSLSLYDELIASKKYGLLPNNLNAFSVSKTYIGMLLNLVFRPSDLICQTDKGIFVMLYLADHIKPTLTMDDLDKDIQGPSGEIPVAQIIQVLSSVASTCPDKSIRFCSYKLIEKFLKFCTDEPRFLLLAELIERCPFPSMNTAAIGLLKDQVSSSFQEKTFSMFASPLILSRFFPIIFKFKSDWKMNGNVFWDDYNHVMQALNFYYFLLNLDRRLNVTTVWNQDQRGYIKKDYLNPLESLLNTISTEDLQRIQVDTMMHIIDKIKNIM